MLFTPGPEEKSLKLMVSNKRPFERHKSLDSDYSGDRVISSLSLTFDRVDRASRPESVVLEEMQWGFFIILKCICGP